MSIVSHFYQGAPVRTVAINGEPWFVLADLCKVLDIKNVTQLRGRLPDGVYQTYPISDSLGRTQQATIVDEPGMYEVIFRSDKPEAVDFRSWVTGDVLPTIRKTGRYGSDVDMLAALPSSKLLTMAAEAAKRAEDAEHELVEARPKVAAYDALMDAEGFYTMEAVAKIGGIGRTTLFRRLREAGVIQSAGRLPYQRYMHWFKITTSTWTDGEGIAHASSTARVRPVALVRVLNRAGMDPLNLSAVNVA